MLKMIWNKQDNLLLPSGKDATPAEVYNEFPFTRFAEVLVTLTNRGVVAAIDDIDILKDNYGIDSSLYGQAAIDAIVEAQQAQAMLSQAPSAEERIAAALEFQNLMNTL